MEILKGIETTEKNKNNFLSGQESNSQEAAQRLQDIGSSILRAARDELYLGMRFLDVALSSFVYRMDGSVSPFGTDGAVIYFHPAQLGGLYKENRILVNRGYLHMVFHCIFRHFGKPGADKRLWNLSCDIAVEHMIDGIYHRSVRYSEVFSGGDLPSSGKGKEDVECGADLQDFERTVPEGKRTAAAGKRVLCG